VKKEGIMSHEEAIRVAAARHGDFVREVMPAVRRCVNNWFRTQPTWTREDIAHDIDGVAWKYFIRFIRMGHEPMTLVGAIVHYSVRSYRHGERVNGQEKPDGRALSSRPLRDVGTITDTDYLHDLHSHRVPVPDEAAFNLDFTTWRATWDTFNREVIDLLATGHRPEEVRARTGKSKGQLEAQRGRFLKSWENFQGSAA
jgi:hypothetical protein